MGVLNHRPPFPQPHLIFGYEDLRIWMEFLDFPVTTRPSHTSQGQHHEPIVCTKRIHAKRSPSRPRRPTKQTLWSPLHVKALYLVVYPCLANISKLTHSVTTTKTSSLMLSTDSNHELRFRSRKPHLLLLSSNRWRIETGRRQAKYSWYQLKQR